MTLKIVPFELFKAVQEKMSNFTVRLSNEELLRRLRLLWNEKGFLTSRMIDKARNNGVPNASVYRNRFGGLANALRLVGFKGNENGVTKRKLLATLRRENWQQLKADLTCNGVHLRAASWYPYQIHVSGAPVMNFVLAHPVLNASEPTWELRPPRVSPIGSCVVGMLAADSNRIIEFVVCRPLRLTPVTRCRMTLTTLATVRLVRLTSPNDFTSALRAIGYVAAEPSCSASPQVTDL